VFDLPAYNQHDPKLRDATLFAAVRFCERVHDRKNAA
jgi:hypothetical protein